jgi:hypothetical protein
MAATILEGSYRDIAAASAEVFHLAYVMVLAEYPDDCIRYVTDPRSGIQSFSYSVWRDGKEKKAPFVSWPPNPGEVQEACEKYMGPIRRRDEIKRLAHEQEQESRRLAEVHVANEAARPVLQAAIAREATIRDQRSLAGSMEDTARRIASQIEHAERARRVEEDCARRRASRVT